MVYSREVTKKNKAECKRSSASKSYHVDPAAAVPSIPPLQFLRKEKGTVNNDETENAFNELVQQGLLLILMKEQEVKCLILTLIKELLRYSYSNEEE